jgi:dipicolinate synthase subunit A
MAVKKIVFCGGDKRELSVMNAFVDAGFAVQAYGVPEEFLPQGVKPVAEAKEALKNADICILPQPPLGKAGSLHSLCSQPVFLLEEDLETISPGTPILCGVASMTLRYQAEHCRIYELTEDDRMAVPMAAATAEGAIAEAIMLNPRVLVGHRALVIGFGRIGRELAWRLEGMGMNLTVLNRGQKRSQEAEDMGYHVVERSKLVATAREADYIFNTVPSLLLDEVIIGLLHRDTTIIDLAAFPGGTDFTAAERRGIKAIHAGGMPGKYSSEYAGEIMAKFYLHFLEELAEKGVMK